MELNVHIFLRDVAAGHDRQYERIAGRQAYRVLADACRIEGHLKPECGRKARSHDEHARIGAVAWKDGMDQHARGIELRGAWEEIYFDRKFLVSLDHPRQRCPRRGLGREHMLVRLKTDVIDNDRIAIRIDRDIGDRKRNGLRLGGGIDARRWELNERYVRLKIHFAATA